MQLTSPIYPINTRSYRYWTLNPRQETVEHHMSPQDPIERAREVVASTSREDGGPSASGGAGGGVGSSVGGEGGRDRWRTREKNDSPV